MEEIYQWMKNKCKMMDWMNITIYLILFITLISAIYLEYIDIYCQGESRGNVCKKGEGASYYKGKPKNNDDIDTLLMKMRISSRYDICSVYWRRSIIFSIILSFVGLWLLLKRIPTGAELLVFTLITYLLTYFMFHYYQHSISYPAFTQFENIIKLLKEKI